MFLLGTVFSLQAADFFWEDPSILSENSFFPQTKGGDGIIVSVWQEYTGKGDSGGTISLYSAVSQDGLNWSSKVNITGVLPFSWDQKVSLFSFVVDRMGVIHVAFALDENTITFYRSDDKGLTFSEEGAVQAESTIVAPRLFLKEDDSLILFVTQKADLFIEGIPGTLSVYFTETDAEGDWAELSRFVENDNLLQSFLPFYASWNGEEYVIFQAILSSVNFQLFMKKRNSETGGWSEEILLTDFIDPATPELSPDDFSNQRPFLAAYEDHLSLVWERNEFGLNSRIYYMQLDRDGNRISDVEAVTEDYRISAFPRIASVKGEEILLWFDNRDGYRVIMAQKVGLFWDDSIVSTMNGDSTYGYFVPFRAEDGEEELLIAWENVSGTRNRTVILSPDQTVDKPRISPVNFIRNRRSSQEFPSFTWTEPVDSSYIRGYSYIWTQDQEEVPPQKLDLRGDPLRRRMSFQATGEGLWYLKVIAQDYAGNWSDPAELSFYYDITPPGEVVFIEPATNPFGYALSNTFDLRWEDPPDEDIERYLYRINFLGSDIFYSDYNRLSYATPTREVPLDRRVQINNYDNGYWGITVVAEDTAGNRSKPSIQVFRLNKYIPVTYITNVTATTDDLLRVKLTIRGRGFKTQGEIGSVIIDRDGKEPWDLQYFLDKGDYAVLDDRTISGPLIDDIEEGIYRIGVIHPERDLVFWRNQMQFDSTGVVKFGDFTTDYKSVWNLIPYKIRTVPGNLILTITVMSLLGLIITLSAFRMVQIGKEIRELTYDSKALFEGGLLTDELRKEKLKTMKRKGVGLRMKFLMALLALVISVILMLAVSLGLYMINQQRENLGDSVKQRAELLLATIVSGAENSLQQTGLDRSLGLLAIPRQTNALDEAIYTTITGTGSNDRTVYNYIWANNDPDITSKFALSDSLSENEGQQVTDGLDEAGVRLFNRLYGKNDNGYSLNEDISDEDRISFQKILAEAGLAGAYTVGGEKQIFDIISTELKNVEQTINEQGREIVGDIPAKLEELQRRGIQLATTGGSREEINLIQSDIQALSEDLNNKLTNIADQSFIYPRFVPAELNRDQLEYIFYRPIVYQDSNTDSYYRGAVRLGITIAPLLDTIDENITGLIRITIFISLAALALGIVGALILASTMINPIKKLVAGVERIRDAEDITKLEAQNIIVKSKDELYDLAESVNQMTSGLIKAAVANQQLMLGQEVQKKFVRLDPVPSGEERKLPSGYTDDEYAEFYGYYVGAKGVSGDYFNYKKIDDEHYACIKCDISGKDIPASLIMVVVATVFDSYCKNLNLKRDGIHLNKMVADVNDLIEQLEFKGKFAAFTVALINIRTGKTWMSNAGDNIVHFFDSSKRAMDSLTLHKAPAAGPFSTDLVDMQGGFKQETHTFRSGDIVFLFTDGIEESQRSFRNSDLKIIECEGCEFAGEKDAKENRDTDTHLIGSTVEELGLKRIDEIANAILNGEKYELIKHHNPFPDDKLTFDFSGCYDSIEDGVMGLLAVEKIFRLFPDPNAGPGDRIMIYRKIDEFLRDHFDQYKEYFRYPVEHPEMPEYIYYTHLKENAQYDDLTVLAIRKK
ncbi:SpoIIE family protein phosphatase [Spirochaeta isovalerica]|uniref:Serine phosphatase RsbU (Regulator of sigma subunit) n=1 Tax=Spirochaeta isovalerica TaxID=150 RepID=A0A841R5Q4_9SPIO|nr:SpoIIE family protein phosphatase [Spirochaeta isovalerica]MBB6479166.1 serine phosphatase RsbU (regulator of sigma subunit) [Spirochaeta isovalerica]